MLALGVLSLAAQLDLENTVPSNWTVSAGSLTTSSAHYKLGTRSLQWNWTANSVLTVTNPGIAAAEVTDFYQHTCDLWVHNPGALPGQKLRFEFVSANGTAQYHFDFHLDYTGWRRAVRSFRYDMNGPKQSASFNRVRLVGPASGSGQLFLDAVTWVGPRFTRHRDAQNVDIRDYLSDTNYYHAYYTLGIPDIPATAPTAAELSELATLRTRWLADNAGSAPSGSALNTARTAWTNLNLVVSGDDIRGQVITQDTSAFENWVITFGRDVYWTTNADSLSKLTLLLRHWWDQGWDFGSGEAQAGGSGGYDFRATPRGFILGHRAYDAAFKDRVWRMLHWMYRLGDFWEPNWAPGYNTDDIYLNSRQQLGAILFLTPDDATAVQYLKGFKRFIERFLVPSHGTGDGVKVDGLGFHHRSHYNAYMYAFRELSDQLHLLRGTQFQINSGAYLSLRNAFFAMLRMANSVPGTTSPGYAANSVSGRHPFVTALPFGTTTLQRLGVWGGLALGQSADPVVAQAYNRLFASSYPYATFTPYGPEPNPTGFHQFNYSPIGVYRQANWVAAIRGMNNVFWGAEIYSDKNRYGRYQSYGALEILYPGGHSASGFGLTGWDWNKPPGTTTILLPGTKLIAENAREDVRSVLNFAGGLAFHGQGGLYACNFQEVAAGTNHNATFVWRKSWFCFDDQIVCLGSDIRNNDAVNPTITTLFQGRLPTTATATVLNGTSVTTFPNSTTNSGASARWLLDGYATGYFVRPGAPLRLTRALQTSPDETGSGATSSANHATAWLDHGGAPTGASYEYVVIPATTAAAMAQLATDYTNALTTPYEVLQQNTNAHVVRWKPDNRIGYALFATNALASTVTNAGPLRTVSRPCLVMTQPDDSDTLWLTVVDPNLNFVNNVSTPRNLDVSLAGHWWIAAGPTNAAVLSMTANRTVLRVQTVHGLPVELQLKLNRPPTISALPNQTLPKNGSTGPLVVTLSDDATPPAALTLTASSLAPAVVPEANIILGGSGANRTVTITPALNATGSAAVTLTASDGADSASTDFTVTVFNPNAVILSLTPSTNSLALAWPADIGDWTLYAATNLTPPVTWLPVTDDRILSNQQWLVILPATPAAAWFYRLQTP